VMLPPLQPTLGAYVTMLFRRFDEQPPSGVDSLSNVALYKATPSQSSSTVAGGQVEVSSAYGCDSDEGIENVPLESASTDDSGDGLHYPEPTPVPFFNLHASFAAFTMKHYSEFADKPPGPRFKSSLHDAVFSSGPYCIDKVELCVAIDKKWVLMHKFSSEDLASFGRELRSTTRYFCLR